MLFSICLIYFTFAYLIKIRYFLLALLLQVCGGGPKLSLWHLRSMEVTTVFPITDLKGVHVAKFHEDRVFAGGAGPHFYQLSLNGQIHGQIPTSASTVYSAEFRESPQKVLYIFQSYKIVSWLSSYFQHLVVCQ